MKTPAGDQPARDLAMPSLDSVVEDAGRLATLPFEAQLEIWRRVRHLEVDVEVAVLRRLGDGNVVTVRSAVADDDRLLSVPEAAAQLGLAPSYVYELARTGALPTMRLGKYVRVRVGALRRWLAARENAIDAAGSETLPFSRDPGRRPARPPRPRADAGRLRRAARRPPGHGEEMGGRHAGDAEHGNPRDPVTPRAGEGKGRGAWAASDDDERW
jgi:excisionase family DNA binding protein